MGRSKAANARIRSQFFFKCGVQLEIERLRYRDRLLRDAAREPDLTIPFDDVEGAEETHSIKSAAQELARPEGDQSYGRYQA